MSCLQLWSYKRISANDPFCFMGSWKSCYKGEKCKYVLIITMKMFLSHSSCCKRQLSILVIPSDKTESAGISVMMSPPCWIYNPFNTAESGRKERGKEGMIFIWKRKNDSSITWESKDAACHPTSRLPPHECLLIPKASYFEPSAVRVLIDHTTVPCEPPYCTSVAETILINAMKPWNLKNGSLSV